MWIKQRKPLQSTGKEKPRKGPHERLKENCQTPKKVELVRIVAEIAIWIS